jgi:hypothetical protein
MRRLKDCSKVFLILSLSKGEEHFALSHPISIDTFGHTSWKPRQIMSAAT